MIGHNQVIKLRMDGYKPNSVFIQFGEPFNAEKDVINKILPTVFIGSKDNPKLVDLTWATGLDLQLMPAKDMDQFVKWWCALVDAGPKTMVGLDNDGEISVYTK